MTSGLQTGLGRLMDYDAELRLLNQALRLAYGIERHDREISAGGRPNPHQEGQVIYRRLPGLRRSLEMSVHAGCS